MYFPKNKETHKTNIPISWPTGVLKGPPMILARNEVILVRIVHSICNTKQVNIRNAEQRSSGLRMLCVVNVYY